MYLLAFAACWFLGRIRIRQGRLPGVDEAAYGDLLFYGMLGVVLGGRIGYILFYDLATYLAQSAGHLQGLARRHEFPRRPARRARRSRWLWSRRRGLHFFDIVDFIAPLVPPGLAFGRLGNFINGELWGKPTDVTGASIFPRALPSQLADLDPAALQRAVRIGRSSMRRAASLAALRVRARRRGACSPCCGCYSRKPRPRYAVSAACLR